jgi:hypothetical protein
VKIPKAPKKKTETDLVREILGALNRLPGVRAVRNNTGKLQDKNGRWVTYGLGVGGPDIVGVIRWELIGRLESHLVSSPFGVEVKRPGKKRTNEQISWANAAKNVGMTVGVATSVAEALAIVEKVRNG